MRRFPIIVLATLALGGTAFSAERGASSKTPGHEMKSVSSESTGFMSRTGMSGMGGSGTRR